MKYQDRALCHECANILAGAWVQHRCFGCGRSLSSAHFDAIPPAESKSPSVKEPSPDRVYCERCQKESSPVEGLVALGNYQDVLREAVIASKQTYHAALAMALGRVLGRMVRETLTNEDIACVTYIPSHWLRRCSRGGTPTQLIASEVAKELGRPLRALLRATRRTRKQGTLRDEERAANVSGAYSAKKRYAALEGAVLVVDDVWTTGATVQEVASELKKSGAPRVFAAVVARAIGQHGV